MRNFELLQQVKMPTEQEEICKFFCGDPTMQGITTISADSVLASDTAGSETIVSKIPPKKDITRLEVRQLMHIYIYIYIYISCYSHNC